MWSKIIFQFAELFPKREFRGSNGDLYMTRYTLLGSRDGWGRICLNHIHRRDADRNMHNHPWEHGYSIIISGGYIDEVEVEDRHIRGFSEWREHSALSFNKIPKDLFHRIVSVYDNTWTLMFVSKRIDDWGFKVNGKFIPHKEYFEQKNIKDT